MFSQLTALAEWLSLVGERIATGKIAAECVAEWLAPEVVTRHALYWADRLGDPRIGDVPWMASRSEDFFEIERSVVCPLVLSPQTKQSLVPQNSPPDFSEGDHVAYVAKLRHMRRRHRDAVRWLQEFSSFPDLDRITKAFISSRVAVIGFAIALWGMQLEMDFDLRRWWQRRYRRINLPSWQRRQKRFGLGLRSPEVSVEECGWLKSKVEEAELELIWQCASAMAEKLGSAGYGVPKAIIDLLGTNECVNWTACRRLDGHLEVLTTLPIGFDSRFGKRRYLSKKERCDAWDRVEIPKREAFLGSLSANVLVQDEGRWCVKKGHLPRVDPRGSWCRKHRLIASGKCYRAISFKIDDRFTVGRGLDVPVEIMSVDSVENIVNELKVLMSTVDTLLARSANKDVHGLNL